MEAINCGGDKERAGASQVGMPNQGQPPEYTPGNQARTQRDINSGHRKIARGQWAGKMV